MTEKDKMLAGEWYDANYDDGLVMERARVGDLCYRFNQLPPSDFDGRNILLKEILRLEDLPEGLEIISPLRMDYGYLTRFGDRVHVASNCFFMDGGGISIGNDVYIGPDCGFYTATHPMSWPERNRGIERALPIRIGNNCWFGGKVTVLAGVTIGDGCVIAAGSVVIHDVPPDSMAAGVPAVIKKKIIQGHTE